MQKIQFKLASRKYNEEIIEATENATQNRQKIYPMILYVEHRNKD